jgi:hypothetical protein
MALGKIFLACDRADAKSRSVKCTSPKSLWGMVGVLGLRGQLDAKLVARG